MASPAYGSLDFAEQIQFFRQKNRPADESLD
jgi:hypothetical protein